MNYKIILGDNMEVSILFSIICAVCFIFSVLVTPKPPAEAAQFPTPRPKKCDHGTFLGGVFDGTHIWLVPRDSSDLIKINPLGDSVEFPTPQPKKSDDILDVLRIKNSVDLDVLRSR